MSAVPAGGWVRVCARSELLPGEFRVAWDRDVAIAVFNIEGELYAVEDVCTHDGGSLDHKLSDIHLPRGASDAAVIAELAPGPDEIVLPKTSSGVFNSTNIDYVLRNLGVRFLVVTGR